MGSPRDAPSCGASDGDDDDDDDDGNDDDDDDDDGDFRIKHGGSGGGGTVGTPCGLSVRDGDVDAGLEAQ